MAGESLSLSELKQWYAAFDAVVTAHGGGALSTLGVPDGGTAVPSDINNLYNQITAFRNDTYFKTQPTLYATDYSLVSAGTLIQRNVVTPITTTVTGIARIKCRNEATNSSGTNSHGANNHGTCTRGDNSQTCTRNCSVSCNHGDYGNNCSNARSCSNGDYGQTCNRVCSRGDNSETCGRTCYRATNDPCSRARACSNGDNARTCSRCWNIPNVNSSTCVQTINSKTTNTRGDNSETCSRTISCTNGTNTNSRSMSCSYSDNSRTCSSACQYGDNANNCSSAAACWNVDNSNTCGSTCTRSCSHGDNSKTCSHSTNAHVAFNHTLLSNTKLIDILNSSATKTNS